jgi:uncharacterized protein
MKLLTKTDIEEIALGATIIGSGGGGDPLYHKLMVQRQIDQYGAIELISCDELHDDDLIIPLSMMGAPLVGIERLHTGREFEALLNMVAKVYGKQPRAVLPSEIGGANSLTPFLCSGSLSIPVLDADIIGRAFPELQMSSAEIMGVAACPAFMGDCYGNAVVIGARDGHTLEQYARSLTVEMGSVALVAIYPMTGFQAKQGAVLAGSVSRVKAIGNRILDAVKSQQNPAQVLMASMGARNLGLGMIDDMSCSIQDGFMRGTVTVACRGSNQVIHYQNEYLVAYENDCVVASTPDIIVLLEEETGMPVTSERLSYGLRVHMLVLDSPDIWKTEKGLSLVGPRVFGFDFDYKDLIGK